MRKIFIVSYQVLILLKFIKNGISANCFGCDNEEKDLYEIRFDQIGIPNNELVKDFQDILLEINAILDGKLEGIDVKNIHINVEEMDSKSPQTMPFPEAQELLISLHEKFEQIIRQKFPLNWKVMAHCCHINRKIKQHEKLLCLYGKNIAFIETIYKILLAKNLAIVRYDAQSKIEFLFGQMNAIFQIIATIHDSNYMKYNFYGDEVKKMVKKMMRH